MNCVGLHLFSHVSLGTRQVARAGVTKMVILITDGKSHSAAETETEAEGARNDDNIQMFTVGGFT